MNPKVDWEEILRAAHEEPIGGAHYTAVRSRVLAELERRQRRRWWMWFPAVAALAAMLLMMRVPRPELPPLRAVSAVIPRAPEAPKVVPAKVPVVVAVAKKKSSPREPLTIKMQTSDPNIVIYWIAD